jgi:uncharacterized protein
LIAVLDTNVWVSAFKFGGAPREALLRAAARRELATSNAIEAETIRVLHERFQYTAAEVEKAIAPFKRRAFMIRITGSVQGVCRDPNDDHLLECAQKSEAALIVTGDRDLLSLEFFGGRGIITPREYIKLVTATAGR